MRKSKLQTVLTKEMLEYNYKKYGSMQKMADELNIGIDSIYKYMKLHNVNYDAHYTGIYECDENIFKEETERAFYLAGFIAADGCVYHRKHSSILSIALSIKDIEHLQNIKKLFRATNKIEFYTDKNNLQSCRISIVSKIICKDLEKFNIVPRKSLIYTFPEWLTDHPLVHHFIRGYADGDGSWSNRHTAKNRIIKQTSFSILGTQNLVLAFKKIIEERCQIKSMAEIKKRDDEKVYRLTYYGNNMVSKIYEFLYNSSSIYLSRKRNIAKLAKELSSNNKNFARHIST
jgi:hypothetical protein